MVQSPKTRHSKSRRDPVTIDLDPKEVSRADPAETSDKPDKAAQDKQAKSAAAADPKAGKAESKPDAAKDESAQAKTGAAGPSKTEPKPGQKGGPIGDGGSGPSKTKPESTAGPARRTGGMSALGAGVAGGIVALAAAASLQFAGVLPNVGGPNGSAAVAALETQVGSLERRLAESAGDGAESASAALDAANARIDSVSSSLDELQSTIASLSAAGDSAPGANGEAVAALGARLDDIEQRLENRASGDAASSETVQSLEQRLGALEATVQTADEAAKAAQESVAQQTDQANRLDERLATLETRMSELAARLDEQADNPRLAQAIAASALKSAIDRGEPFMDELETYATLAPDGPEIAALRDLAAAGVPTREAIAGEAGEAASSIVRSTQNVNEEASFVERLYSSAQSLVSVRPVGDVEGDSVPAIVARMEAAIKAGDYDKAIAEYDALPEPAKAAGADFAAKVRARMTADELVDTALAGALKS